MNVRSTLLAAGLFLTAASAQATVVTFDDLSLTNNVGYSFPTANVTEQYASLGVHFSGATFSAFNYFLPAASYPGSPASFNNPSNIAGLLFSNVITATFDQAVSNVSLLFADTEIGSFLGNLRAFDAAGNLLGEVSSNTPNNAYPGFATLSLNIGGISRVTFQSDSDGAVVDDFTFTPPARATVPEPGMLSLLGLGLMGLAFTRKKA